jgi:hypothetical protein
MIRVEAVEPIENYQLCEPSHYRRKLGSRQGTFCGDSKIANGYRFPIPGP